MILSFKADESFFYMKIPIDTFKNLILINNVINYIKFILLNLFEH